METSCSSLCTEVVDLIEKILFDYLSAELADPVYMEYPEDAPPERFYLLEKTGGNIEDKIGYATFALQSYGGSLFATASMNSVGISAMLDAVALDAVSSVSLNSDYNFTDTTRRRHRYQAVFNITHYETE